MKKILINCGIGLILLAIVGFSLSLIYEDDVKQFALDKISEQLITEFNIADSKLSIWRQFPNASLELNDIYIEDTFEESDTLLFAKKVYLEFDLLDLFKGEYVVEEVTIDEAYLSLKWNEENEDNFHFWQQSDSSSKEFQFAIETINLSDTKFRMDQKSADFYLESFLTETHANGNFTQSVYDLEVTSDLILNSIRIEEDLYANQNEVVLDYNIKIDQENSEYSFNEGELIIEGLKFDAGGMVKITEDGNFCDLKFTGSKMPVKKSKSLIPEKYLASLEAYKMSGKFDATCTVKGYAGSGNVPDVTIIYSLNNIDLSHFKSGLAITDIQAKGHFEKRPNKPELIKIDELQADFEKGLFSVKGFIENFGSPTFDLTMMGNIDLADFKRFTESESMEGTKGKIRFNSQFKGSLTSLNPIIASEINALDSKADVELIDAAFKIKGSDHLFENLNGELKLSGPKAQLKNVTGIVGPSDFKLEGKMNNLLAYILVEDEILDFDAYLNSNLLDFNNLLANSNSQSSEDQYNLTFPEDIKFKFSFSIDKLEFREFNASNLKGKARLEDQIIVVDPFEFNSSEGKLLGTFAANGQGNNGFDLSSKVKIDKINIHQLFGEFENFGQDFLVGENIKGVASAQIDFKAYMSSNLKFDSEKLYSLIDITVDDGELIGLSSMEEICDYIRSNKLVAPFVDEDKLEDKLEHIYFSELSNKIEIRNQKINIPEMTIKSSAMDISAEGNHHFNNQIDYTLGFKVRDILCKDNQTEFGIVEDDGLSNSFYLSMTGTTADPSFGYDRLAHKEKRQEDFQKEKTVFKELIKNEFRKEEDKKDVVNNDPPKDKVTVVVEDEKKDKKKKKWWETDEDDEEEEEITVDDDEDF